MDNEKKQEYSKQYAKKTNYAAQRRYAKKHPEQRRERDKRYKKNFYNPKLSIRNEYKDVLSQLSKDTDMSINMLFITAVEEKYGVILHKNGTENEEENN